MTINLTEFWFWSILPSPGCFDLFLEPSWKKVGMIMDKNLLIWMPWSSLSFNEILYQFLWMSHWKKNIYIYPTQVFRVSINKLHQVYGFPLVCTCVFCHSCWLPLMTAWCPVFPSYSEGIAKVQRNDSDTCSSTCVPW